MVPMYHIIYSEQTWAFHTVFGAYLCKAKHFNKVRIDYIEADS